MMMINYFLARCFSQTIFPAPIYPFSHHQSLRILFKLNNISNCNPFFLTFEKGSLTIHYFNQCYKWKETIIQVYVPYRTFLLFYVSVYMPDILFALLFLHFAFTVAIFFFFFLRKSC